MSPLGFQNTFFKFCDHRDRLGKVGRLKTFAKENESLSFKLDFSSENGGDAVLKYIVRVLGSQKQTGDIGQFGDICKRK